MAPSCTARAYGDFAVAWEGASGRFRADPFVEEAAAKSEEHDQMAPPGWSRDAD
jgi:hypothetical protein